MAERSVRRLVRPSGSVTTRARSCDTRLVCAAGRRSAHGDARSCQHGRVKRELVKMRHDPTEHSRQLNAALPEAIPDPRTIAARRDAALARMRGAREAIASEIATVKGIEALRDDAWSTMHVLAHLAGDGGGHFTPAYDMLLRGVTELEPYETRDERFANATRGALERIDGAIAFTAALTPEQLSRSARKDGYDRYVVTYVEREADHFEAHLAQLREA